MDSVFKGLEQYYLDEDLSLLETDGGNQFKARFQEHVEELRYTSIDHFLRGYKKCESPIEKLLFAHLVFLKTGWSTVSALPSHIDWLDPTRVTIFPQHQIGAYRADFAIHVEPITPSQTIKLVIECDGHPFHEKTKEQAKRDKARDRMMAGAGYQVLRFTGSEIFADPAGCADQVQQIIDDLMQIAIDHHLKGGAA